MTQPVDSSILHEIVRIVESRRKVPEKVIVKSREYLLTYLEDHQRRMEEALQRFDRDRLNMLYGQLASKIKYQLLRRVPGRAGAAPPAPAPSKPAAKPVAAAKKTAAAKPAAKKAAPTKRPAAATRAPTARRPAAAAGKVAAKKVAGKKPVGKKPAGKKPAAKAKKSAAKRGGKRR